VQEFTIEFKKRAIQMGISLKIPYILIEYLGASLPQIRRKLKLFRKNMIDEVSIQAQYLEGDKKK
jgi:hypothetical protein